MFEYNTTFDAGVFLETAVASQEKDVWKVAGYFVRAQ